MRAAHTLDYKSVNPMGSNYDATSRQTEHLLSNSLGKPRKQHQAFTHAYRLVYNQLMRICLLTHSFPPVIGGAQTYQYYLAKFLSDFGHKVQVVTGETPPQYKNNISFSYTGFKVVPIEGLKEAAKLGVPYQTLLPEIHKVIAQFTPDIVYSHGYGPCLIYSLLQKSIRAKHVFTYHSTPIPEEQKLAGIFENFELEKSFTEFIFRHCSFDKYIANSRYYLESALANGVDSKKSILVYHGVDLNLFNQKTVVEREKYGYSQNDFVICCPVRLIERKGILDIIESLKLINNKRVKLLIPTSRLYTPKNFESTVLTLIKKYRLSNEIKIIFDKIGVFEMPRIYALSDMVVLPSHVEGLGIILLEALAMKKPVVGTNVVGISEIIKDGETGLLAKAKNPADLADKITRLIKDPKLAKKLAERGNKMVKEKFDIIKQIKKIEGVFNKL